MRVAVMGAGGTGGWLGAYLARAGNDVTLIARGAHLQAIQQSGLRLLQQDAEFSVKVNATEDPAEVGPVDLVLFTVKTYQNAAAFPVIGPIVGKETTVLTLQNGVDSGDQLAQVFGRTPILPGASWTTAHIESPGVVRQQTPWAKIVFGEVDGRKSPRALRVQEMFADAGVETELSEDVTKVLWTKFLAVGPLAGITSASRTRTQRLIQYPESKAALHAAFREVEAVALAKGVNLDSDVVEETVRFVDNVPDIQVSMHADIDQGRLLELEAMVGCVVKLGRELGVPTPIHELLYALLLPHNDGAT